MREILSRSSFVAAIRRETAESSTARRPDARLRQAAWALPSALFVDLAIRVIRRGTPEERHVASRHLVACSPRPAAATLALAEQHDEWPSDLAERIHEDAAWPDLFSSIAWHRTRRRLRRNLLEIALARRDPAALPLLEHFVLDIERPTTHDDAADPGAGRRLAETLAVLAEAIALRRPRAVTAAAAEFDHLRTLVQRHARALRRADPPPPGRALTRARLAEAEAWLAFARPVRGPRSRVEVRRIRPPEGSWSGALVDRLHVPGLARDAARTLLDGLRTAGPDRWSAVLLAGPRLRLPTARRALRSALGRASPPRPRPDDRRRLRADAAIGLLDWLDAMPLPPEAGLDPTLLGLLAHNDPRPRLRALRRVAAVRPERAGSRDAVAVACFDPERNLARIGTRLALRHLAGNPIPRPAERRVAGPGRGSSASRHVDALFAEVWKAWRGRVVPASARLLALRLRKDHRAALLDRLGTRLTADRRTMALQACRMTRDLRLEGDLDGILPDLAGIERDPWIAATATRLLPAVPGDRARAALRAALDHPDPRVRANAVESLPEGEEIGRMTRLARTGAHRERAGAVRRVLGFDRSGGLEAVSAMLGDERVEHRAGALWLVTAETLLPRASVVARLARSDDVHEIRRRAERAAELLGRRRRLATDPDREPASPDADVADSPPAMAA